MIQNRTVRVCNGCGKDIVPADGNYHSLVYMGDVEFPGEKLTLNCQVTRRGGPEGNLDVCNNCMLELLGNAIGLIHIMQEGAKKEKG